MENMTDPLLELKLELLHHLLVVEGVKEVLSDQHFSQILEEEFDSKKLRVYVEELTSFDDSFSKDYIEKLRVIRDYLLRNLN